MIITVLSLLVAKLAFVETSLNQSSVFKFVHPRPDDEGLIYVLVYWLDEAGRQVDDGQEHSLEFALESAVFLFL